MANKKQEEVAIQNAFQKRFRKFSRLAVGIIYLQSRNLQLKQQITEINSQISDAETDLNNAKQEVNELTRSDRIAEIAKKAGLNIDNSNLGNVGSNK